MESERGLPEGWSRVTLADVCQKVPNVKPEDEPEREFGYVDISAISNTTFTIGETKRFLGKDAPSRARRPIEPGDVLFSTVRTYLRNIAMVHEGLDATLCSTGFTVLRSNGAVVPQYLFHYTLSEEFINAVTPQQTGTQYPATSDRVVFSTSIPLPPFAEQRRIVARFEALLADLERVRGRLEAVAATMLRFRQAVLGAACSGRLTEGWREEHIVLQETSWELSKLQDMGNWSTGGTPPRQIKSFFAGNIPWVKSGDLNDGVIADTEERISKEGLDNSNAKILPVGTISMALYGATIGKVGILGIEAATNQACANCIVNKEKIINKYLFYFLIEQRQSFIDAGQGGAQPNLTNKIVREWPIYLPSLPEQQEIVRRVEALFALADRIEGEVARALERVEALREAVLAKAFRGELVPTEVELARREGREYEPAAVLLERVRAGREDGRPRSGKRSTLQTKIGVE